MSPTVSHPPSWFSEPPAACQRQGQTCTNKVSLPLCGIHLLKKTASAIHYWSHTEMK